MDYHPQQDPHGHSPQAGYGPQGSAAPGHPAQGHYGAGAGIAHAITHGPSFAMLRVDLQPGQVLVSEAGAMVARHSQVGMTVEMNASRSAGFFGMIWAFFVAIVRKVIGGETFFVNHFTAPQGGSVWVAPTMSGQISHRRLGPGERLVLSSGAFLAGAGDVDIRMKFGGLRSLLAKEGAFMLEVVGGTAGGELWFTSYGGIHAIDINGPYIVDNGHLVGYEGQLTMNIRTAGGGLMGFMASGEGLVCEFTGQGRLYIQSRNLSALAGWLGQLVP